MVVVRDEKKLARYSLIGKIASFVGMAILLSGLVLAFTVDENDSIQILWLQVAIMLVGFMVAQFGVYLAQRYIRRPRADEVLDEAIRKMAKDGRLYHYVLPVPHLLLLPTGIVVLVAKYQGGQISVDGDKWKQSGLGFRRFFGQEGVGNPTKEAENQVAAIAHFLQKNAPEVEEVPIGALIVFTTDYKGKKGENLDLARSRIPAMHYSKVRRFLKQKKRDEKLPPADYEAIRRAFDDQAGSLVEP